MTMIERSASGRKTPKKGGRRTGPSVCHLITERILPEEIVDHVDHFARIGVDQKRVVIIADPARTAVGGRQAVIAGVVDPVARAIEQRVQAEAEAEPRISVTAIRRSEEHTSNSSP